jgi:plastocyanin
MRAAALALGALAVAPSAAVAADSAEIVAGPGNGFLTASVEVDQGGRVTLANRDATAHDVTARGDGPDGKPLFASPLVQAGGSGDVAGVGYLTSGSYAFFCSVHPQMTGTLRVTTAGTPDPRPGGGSGGGSPSADVTPPRLQIARPRGLGVTVTSDEPAAISVVARRRGKRAATGRARVGAAGRVRVRLRPTAAGRRALRRGRRVAVRLTVTGRDAAGNRTRVVRRAALRR